MAGRCYPLMRCRSRTNKPLLQHSRASLIQHRRSKTTNLSQRQQISLEQDTDVLVLGGGIIGSFVAYWLLRESNGRIKTHIIEKDPNYKYASTVLSAGGIRQQFSLKENIQMSLFGLELVKNAKQYLATEDCDDVDVGFHEHGYLLLAGQHQTEVLHKNHNTQIDCGAKVTLLPKDKVKQRFPWLNCEDIEMAAYGYANEGWLDPWLLLSHVRRKVVELGGTYIHGSVKGFNNQRGSHTCLYESLTTSSMHAMNFDKCVICCGCWSGEVARLAGLGLQSSLPCENVPIPVERRKRFIYYIHAPQINHFDLPMIIDNLGCYIRPEGAPGFYICGSSPPQEESEPDVSNLDVDYEFFDDVVWPSLAHRVPLLESLKVKSAWAGYYDYNTIDQNVIIGQHPQFPQLYIATGASGHGLQQAPAIGKGISELILDGQFTGIDLTRFSFDRIMNNEPIYETNIV